MLVAPVCLDWHQNETVVQDLGPDDSITVTGWGRYTNNRTENNRVIRSNLKYLGPTISADHFFVQNFLTFGAAARLLRRVDLPITDVEECQKVFAELKAKFQICAGGQDGGEF